MWIEFSELNFKLLVMLIFPTCNIAEHFAKKAFIKQDNSFFNQFRYFISYTFSFIFLIISHYKSKSKVIDSESIDENNNENNIVVQANGINNEIDEMKKNINKKRKVKDAIFLLSLCLIGLSSYIYRLIFEKKEYKFVKQGIGVFSEIGFYVLLSYFFLKQKLYKHNFISLIIIGCTLIILLVISLFHMANEYILSSIIYYIFFSLIFSLYDVLGKKYMMDFYRSPYFMMFMIGIINSFLLIIYDIFAYYFNRQISGIIIGFQENITSVGDFFGFFLDVILNFFWNFGIWITIYYFTPCHFFICEYINEYFRYLRDYNDNSQPEFYSKENLIIFSLIYVINFFFFLVFNEVIILNFCNLDYNTKKRINDRMKVEDRATSVEIPLVTSEKDDESSSKKD